jgi:hypothetical protein
MHNPLAAMPGAVFLMAPPLGGQANLPSAEEEDDGEKKKKKKKKPRRCCGVAVTPCCLTLLLLLLLALALPAILVPAILLTHGGSAESYNIVGAELLAAGMQDLSYEVSPRTHPMERASSPGPKGQNKTMQQNRTVCAPPRPGLRTAS